MEDTRNEAAAASAASRNVDSTGAAAGTGKGKKRHHSKPPDGRSAAKKKKKDAADGTMKKLLKLPPAVEALTVSTNTVHTSTIAPTTIPTAAPIIAISSTGTAANLASKPLVDQVLFRLTEGIPRLELKTMVREADDCEKALLREIQLLEEALKRAESPTAITTNSDTAEAAPPPPSQSEAEKAAADGDKKPAASTIKPAADAKAGETAAKSSVELDKQIDEILENPYSPLDRCFTLSALLGRLRDDLSVPSSRLQSPATTATITTKKKKANSIPAPTYPQLVALADNPNYIRVHPEPPTQLLHVWRKIASHRTAMVFRRAVKPEEAPGYAERILFPMDLSLVRKLIVARNLTSYSELHQRIRLISHNCVKYNGRESDYGIVARDFEAAVDEYMMAAVLQGGPQATPTAAMARAGGSKLASPKNGSGRSLPAGNGRAVPKGMNSFQTAAAPSAAAIAAATAAAVAASMPPPSATKTKS